MQQARHAHQRNEKPFIGRVGDGTVERLVYSARLLSMIWASVSWCTAMSSEPLAFLMSLACSRCEHELILSCDLFVIAPALLLLVTSPPIPYRIDGLAWAESYTRSTGHKWSDNPSFSLTPAPSSPRLQVPPSGTWSDDDYDALDGEEGQFTFVELAIC
jgi:hypothetical protein